jgi:YegS/Rv2252/BmrU family lipid kinase
LSWPENLGSYFPEPKIPDMRSDRPLKFLFVLNPVSGGKSKNNWQEAIVNFFKDKAHSLHYYLLKGKNDAQELQREIKQISPDRVIAVGGDGTVNLVAKQLLGTTMSMGILPAGSANGLATELKLPSEQIAALNIIENGMIKPLDAVHINEDVISLHLADLGLNAQLIKYFEESNWRGKLGYAKVLLKTLWRGQKVKVQIETDDQTIVRKVYMVVIANSKTYGTGAVINPDGDLHDGKFEIVIVRKLALSELLKMIFDHGSFDPRKVEVLRTRNVVINSNKATYFQSDGEYLGKQNEIKATILPAQLKMIIQGTQA